VDVQVNSEQALGTVQEMQEAIEQRSSATSATAQQLLATMPGVQGLAALEVRGSWQVGARPPRLRR
jgi:hypothetical protein